MSKIVPVLYKERQFQVAAPSIPVGGITPDMIMKQDTVRQQQIANDQRRVKQAMDTYAKMMEEKRKHNREVGKTILDQVTETYELSGTTAMSASLKDAMDASFQNLYTSISGGYDATEAMNLWKSKFGDKYSEAKSEEAILAATLKNLEEKNKEADTLYQYDIAKIAGDVLLGNVDIKNMTGNMLIEKYRTADYSAIANQVNKDCIEGKISGKSKLVDISTNPYNNGGSNFLVTDVLSSEQTLYDDCPKMFLALTGDAIRKEYMQLLDSTGEEYDITSDKFNQGFAQYASLIVDKYVVPTDYDYNKGLIQGGKRVLTKADPPGGGKNGPGGNKPNVVSMKFTPLTEEFYAVQGKALNSETAKSSLQLFAGILSNGRADEDIANTFNDHGFINIYNSDNEDKSPAYKNLGINQQEGLASGSAMSLLLTPLFTMNSVGQSFPIKYNDNNQSILHAQEIEEIVLRNSDNGVRMADEVIEYIKGNEDLAKEYANIYGTEDTPTGKTKVESNWLGKEEKVSIDAPKWEVLIRRDLELEGVRRIAPYFASVRETQASNLEYLMENQSADFKEGISDKFNEEYSIISVPEFVHESMIHKNDYVTGIDVYSTEASADETNKIAVANSAKYFSALHAGVDRNNTLEEAAKDSSYVIGIVDKDNPGEWSIVPLANNPYKINPLMVNGLEPAVHKSGLYLNVNEAWEEISKLFSGGDKEKVEPRTRLTIYKEDIGDVNVNQATPQTSSGNTVTIQLEEEE